MNMPANRKLKPYLKSHVGRTFTLRKVVLIPTYKDAKGSQAGLVNSIEELGEAVMVLDESNTRVCVIRASGGTTWIPKYYLLKEIKSGYYEKVDNLSECINELGSISKKLRENQNESFATELEKIILNLRTYVDIEFNKLGATDEK
jgi:hypothetical protein